MDSMILPGTPPIAVSLRRSAQARRLSLRVSRLDGRVTLSLPRFVPQAEAMAFLRAREDWVRRALSGVVTARQVEHGTVLPVEGRLLRVTAARVRRVEVADGSLLVPESADPGPRVAAFLRQAAQARLRAACDRHALALGRPYGRITLRDTRSRWGSCTARGDLMFSWRLILAPPPVLDYVAAHEVAHLAHMDHSAAFWATTARLYPDHAAQRAWLRREGGALHTWRFDAA